MATTQGPLAPLLTVRQAAEILNVSRNTVYRLIWDKELPAINVNPRGGRRSLRLHRRDLEVLLATAEPTTAPPRHEDGAA